MSVVLGLSRRVFWPVNPLRVSQRVLQKGIPEGVPEVSKVSFLAKVLNILPVFGQFWQFCTRNMAKLGCILGVFGLYLGCIWCILGVFGLYLVYFGYFWSFWPFPVKYSP